MDAIYSYMHGDIIPGRTEKRTPAMLPVVRRGNTVVPVPVTWLWPGVIPIGKISMLIGDPGLGKSFLTAHLAALLSTMRPFPDHPDSAPPDPPVPAQTLFLSAEDDPADTIVPRLIAHGADLAHIIFLEGVRHRNGEEGAIDLQKSIGALDHALAEMKNPRLVIIDPISAYLGDADSNNNSQVRGLLKQVASIASKRNCAILLVSHLRKEGTERAVYRASGSLAFAAAARSVWLVAKDESGGTLEDDRLLVPVKNNLCGQQKGYRFRVIDGVVTFADERVGMDADGALVVRGEEEETSNKDTSSKFRQFLLEKLGGASGPVSVQSLQHAADSAGLNWSGLRNSPVLRELGIVRGRVGRKSFWQLPDGAFDDAAGEEAP